MTNFIPHFYWPCDYLSSPGLKSVHVCKGCPWWSFNYCNNAKMFRELENKIWVENTVIWMQCIHFPNIFINIQMQHTTIFFNHPWSDISTPKIQRHLEYISFISPRNMVLWAFSRFVHATKIFLASLLPYFWSVITEVWFVLCLSARNMYSYWSSCPTPCPSVCNTPQHQCWLLNKATRLRLKSSYKAENNRGSGDSVSHILSSWSYFDTCHHVISN